MTSLPLPKTCRAAVCTLLTGLALSGNALAAPVTYIGAGFAINDLSDNIGTIQVLDDGYAASFSN